MRGSSYAYLWCLRILNFNPLFCRCWQATLSIHCVQYLTSDIDLLIIALGIGIGLALIISIVVAMAWCICKKKPQESDNGNSPDNTEQQNRGVSGFGHEQWGQQEYANLQEDSQYSSRFPFASFYRNWSYSQPINLRHAYFKWAKVVLSVYFEQKGFHMALRAAWVIVVHVVISVFYDHHTLREDHILAEFFPHMWNNKSLGFGSIKAYGIPYARVHCSVVCNPVGQ